MYKLMDFKHGSIDKCCFNSKLVFEWVKTGKISLREFEEYLDSLKEHSYSEGHIEGEGVNHYVGS